ncbi:MAG: MoxR family ATPase [Oscillospiraceae bacterium]|nr:MoxR family ATPase [Oscillospiraceae bacterium]
MERQINRNEKIDSLVNNIEKVIVGKRDVIEYVITAMLTGGHILIEDVPGVGKTQLAAALSRSCAGEFGRLQLTPDVMPSDITGFNMVNSSTGEFEYKKGAAFCNFLLADEINRASPKSQSALLEIMEEHQISVDGVTHPLPSPFMVMATQNPVETYGTYHLPEAQMDRFTMKISVGYPSADDEITILSRNENDISPKSLEPVVTCDDITDMQQKVKLIRCDEKIQQYIVSIVNATRENDYIKLGVSPRGSIALYRTAKAYAYVMGRGYVIPDDIKALAPVVLSHRIILTPKGRSAVGTSDEMVTKLLSEITVPVG